MLVSIVSSFTLLSSTSFKSSSLVVGKYFSLATLGVETFVLLGVGFLIFTGFVVAISSSHAFWDFLSI
ncbi:hypothetical protein AAID97_01065 [Campylobacter coli]